MSDTVSFDDATTTKKMSKSEAIRQALTKLGNDADASEVRAEAEEACGSEIDIRSVYQIKSNMKTGRDATTKDKPKASKVAKESKAPKAEKQSKPRKPRKAKTAEVESEEAEHHDVKNDAFGNYSKLVKLFGLVKECGGKDVVIQLLRNIG